MLLPNNRILIVDDLPAMREILQQFLQILGFKNILEAANGLDAWNILQESQKPQIIISDWNMPQLSGLELLKKVRSSKEFVNIPFILITSDASVTRKEVAIHSGADDFLSKPINLETLKNTLEKIFE